MRLPEMAHSPAYYPDGGQLMTTFAPSASTSNTPISPPTPIPPSSAARLPHPDPSRSRLSELSSVPEGHNARHHRPLYRDPMGSDPQSPPPLRASLISGSLEGNSVVSASNSTGRKDRTRGSVSEHSSSYLSGEGRRLHNTSPRTTPKRTIREVAPVPDDNPDALVMLFRLTVPVPIFAFGASLYTIFGLLFTVLISPLGFCPPTSYLRNTTFRTRICDLLAPALHVHERLVGLQHRRSSSRGEWVYDDDTSPPPTVDPGERSFSVGGLIAVLLLSSLFSVALMLVVWIAAFFWVFAMVLGNPDGTERKDDGRAAVLGVCRWWQAWLGKARRTP